MGNKEWRWEETFEASDSEELVKYVILIKEKNSKQYLYKSEGFLINE